MSEGRVAFIKSLLESKGYDGIIITVVKDKQQTTKGYNSLYMGAAYSNFYPGYSSSFCNYYSYPYAYGSYYDSFGGQIAGTTYYKRT